MGGVHVHHEIAGTGPAVLLTHGFAASSHMYAATVADLSARPHDDHVGHPGPRQERLADRPGGVLRRRCRWRTWPRSSTPPAPTRAVLVGHSLGGYLSLEFALAHPERVEGLVLVDTGPGFRKDEARQRLERDGRALRRRPRRARARRPARRAPSSTPACTAAPEGLALAARGILRQRDGHVLEALPSIAVPTLVVVGERDEPFLAGSAVHGGEDPRRPAGRRSRAPGTPRRSPTPTSSTPPLRAFLAETGAPMSRTSGRRSAPGSPTTGTPTCRCASGAACCSTAAGRRRRGRRSGSAAACRRRPTPSSPRSSPPPAPSGRPSAPAWASPRRRCSPTAPTDLKRALLRADRHRRARRGASCSASPAADPTSPGSRPGPTRRRRVGRQRAEAVEHERPPRRLRDAARPDRLGRAQALTASPTSCCR